MTIHQKAYRYRIYPTKSQIKVLNKTFGCVRFVWNQLVADSIARYKLPPDQRPPAITEKTLKDQEQYAFLREVSAFALQQKRQDFLAAQVQYFSKTRKKKLGKLKFKKKGVCNDSFRIPGLSLPRPNRNLCSTGLLYLPKFLAPIKTAIDRPFTNPIRSITVSKNKCNQFFVSVLVEEDIQPKPTTGNFVGIDLGLKDLAILSNGIKFDNPKFLRKNQSKITKAQRQLARKKKGSARYIKQKCKLAKLHLKVANQRAFVHHNISSWLVTNFDVICMENLAVSNMVKNHKLAKSISDASWYSLVQMIEYKAKWYGKTFRKIGRFAASSKTCSSCGHKLDELDLATREWTCPGCGVHHNRDLNAAVNVLQMGLAELKLNEIKAEESPASERGDIGRPSGVVEISLPRAESVKRLISHVYRNVYEM